MWFKKSKNNTKERDKEYRFPGRPYALDGHAAAYAAETAAGDVLVVQSSADLAEITGPLRSLAPHDPETASGRPVVIREADRTGQLAALLSGYASSGLRASALINGLDGIEEALYAAAGKRLTCVFNVAGRAVTRQGGSLRGGHDDYYRAAGAGLFQMYAGTAQEAADFTIIAHRVAELSLTPGICAQDLYSTSHSVQNVRLPERDLVMEYLGRPDDPIDSPTPSQAILFGKTRRRIPLWVDPDHPAGIGGVQDEDSYYRALAAQRPFFAGHLEGIIDGAMREFGELTGRFYNRISGCKTSDAEVLVVAQGAVIEELEAVVDYLRSEEKIKAGVLNLSVFRPFPGALFAEMLKGKKAVTVLERTDQPLAEGLPLIKEISYAVEKAVQNGAGREGEPAYPGYPAFRNTSDKPRLLSGAYGVGGRLPSFAELIAVYKNMLPGGKNKTGYYLGTDFDRETPRLPHLEALSQQMNKGYPGLAGLSLSGAAGKTLPQHPGRVIQLYSLASQGALFAGNLFAQTLAESLQRSVRTFPRGGLEPSLQTTSLKLLHADAEYDLRGEPDYADALLVTSHRILELMPAAASLNKEATLIVETNKAPADLWRGLSKRTATWLKEGKAGVFVVDARRIASEAASKPSFIDQLAIWALFGSSFKIDPLLGEDQFEPFTQALKTRLGQVFGPDRRIVDDVIKAVKGGYNDLAELEGSLLEEDVDHPAREAAAPWTVQESRVPDGTVFDPTRFWHSVGYFYGSGETQRPLTDPFLATGVIPARSSAFRDMTPYRMGLPRWLPENCTGCGLCWTFCPDSALPPTIQDLGSVIQTATALCQEKGAGMVQMLRVGANLAKQAHRLMVNDGLGQYVTVGAVLRDAFAQLVEKMGLEGDNLTVLTEEFEMMCAPLDSFPVAKTDLFFHDPDKEEKGSGTVLSLAVNPDSCKGCGLCLEVCPDQALEWADQTDETLAACRSNLAFHMKLPEVDRGRIEKHVSAQDAQSAVHNLLSKTAYNSMVGGDGAAPGDGTKIAVHLVTAVIEAAVQPRFKAHVDRLSGLIKRLEDKIQGKVSGTLEINDFESFGRRLDRLGKKGVTAADLASVVGPGEQKADHVMLKTWSDLLVRLTEQKKSYEEGITGAGRSRLAAVIDPAGGTFWSGTYPFNPHPHPWISQLPGDAPAMAEGVFEGLVRKVGSELADCRRAELELNDKYDRQEHGAFLGRFGWEDFSSEEKELVPPVLVLARAGTTRWEDISALLSRGYPVIVAVINTLGLSVDKNKDRAVNDLAYHALTSHDVFTMQASVGHPGHLIQGLTDCVSRPRPALLHIYAPDPQASGIAPEKAPEQARLAYESRVFPLFRFDPDTAGTALSLAENPDPGKNWTSRELVTTDKTGMESSFSSPLTVADWALGEGRFRKYFNIISTGQVDGRMKPLAEYLGLEPENREGLQPYIHVIDKERGRLAALVAPEMAAAAESRLKLWNGLNAKAAPAVPADKPAGRESKPETESPRREPQPAAAPDQAALQTLTEKLLWLSGFSRDPEYFKQSLREYITRKKDSESNEDISTRSPSG